MAEPHDLRMPMTTFIETDRLLLRPYAPEDVDTLHRLWTTPEVRRYLLDDQIVARDFVVHEIEETRALFQKEGYGQYALWLKEKKALIGFCGYRFFFDPPERHLIYGLAPSYWHQGFATEAARAVIRHSFEDLDFDEIIAAADAPNTASLGVMERAGMAYHKRVLLDGLDTIYYIITQEMWRDASATPPSSST